MDDRQPITRPCLPPRDLVRGALRPFTPKLLPISLRPGSTSMTRAVSGSRPFVLGFACGRCALTPTPHTRLPNNAGNDQENGRNTLSPDLTGPTHSWTTHPTRRGTAASTRKPGGV